MKPFDSLTEIEQFAETPGNCVVGPFSCLLKELRVYGCWSADIKIWRVTHEPGSGRHPRIESLLVGRRAA